MKTAKLVIGIIMIVLSGFILLQSMAAGVVNIAHNNNSNSGSAGFLVAIFYLASGIIYIATRNLEQLGGDLATFILLVLSFLVGIANIGIYKDLIVWSILALIIGTTFFVWHIFKNNKNNHDQHLHHLGS